MGAGKILDLKRFRKENNLNQVALAEYLGVGQSFISQIERGISPLPDNMLERIVANPQWQAHHLVQQTDEAQATPDEVAEAAGDADIQALRKQIEMLQGQVEELKAEKAQYWEMIKNLTAK